MALPVAVEPVNDTTGMSGCLTIGAPALGPVPNTKLTTPGGRPVDKKKKKKKSAGSNTVTGRSSMRLEIESWGPKV